MSIDNTRININRIITTGKVLNVPERSEKSAAFKEVFQGALDQLQDLKFSKHAAMRMEKRNISLSPIELEKIKRAVDKAHEKGIRDSLVLMKNAAFVVNIPSRTVITAVDGENMEENIFTNIDGAVIL